MAATQEVYEQLQPSFQGGRSVTAEQLKPGDTVRLKEEIHWPRPDDVDVLVLDIKPTRPGIHGEIRGVNLSSDSTGLGFYSYLDSAGLETYVESDGRRWSSPIAHVEKLDESRIPLTAVQASRLEALFKRIEATQARWGLAETTATPEMRVLNTCIRYALGDPDLIFYSKSGGSSYSRSDDF